MYLVPRFLTEITILLSSKEMKGASNIVSIPADSRLFFNDNYGHSTSFNEFKKVFFFRSIIKGVVTDTLSKKM
jgi:hypothetical protein